MGDATTTLIRRAGAVTLIAIAGGCVSLGTQLLLARVIGVRSYGLYTLVVTWTVVLAMIAKAGLDPGLVRFGTEYLVAGETRMFASMIRRSSALVCAFAAVLGALFIAARPWVVHGTDPGLVRAVIAGGVIVIFTAWLQMNKVFLYCLKAQVAGATVEQIRGVILVAALALWTAVSARHDAPLALGLTAAAYASSTLLSVAVIARYLRARVPGDSHLRAAGTEDVRAWLRTGLPLLVVAGSQFVVGRTDVLFLGALRPIGQVGVYAVAIAITTPFDLLVGSATMVTAPEIAELHARGRQAELQALVSRMIRAMLVAATPAVAVLAVAGHLVIGIFGHGYSGAYVPMVLLAVAQLVSVVTGAGGYLLSMTGNERAFARAMVGVAVVTLGAYGAFIPLWGPTGAAVATLVSCCLRGAVITGVAHRRLGIVPLPLGGSLPTARAAPGAGQ